MLRELKLTNFRIFDEEVTVRFKPITILIGRNSSGKSSIIKFLLMLQQSGVGSRQFLNPDGDKVHLGAFLGLKNSLTDKDDLEFGLALNAPLIEPNAALASFFQFEQAAQTADLLYKIGATVSYSRRTSSGHASYSVIDELSGTEALRIGNEIVDGSTLLVVDHPPERKENTEKLIEGLPPDERGKFVEESITESIKSIFKTLAEQHVLRVLRAQISSMRHLPAVRAEAAKVVQVSVPPSDHVGATGDYALPHLQQMIEEDRDQYEFVLPHLRNVAGIERVKFESSPSLVSQAYGTNRATGADVLIADYGFGVSQCLPVIVQGAIMTPYTLLLVEQPEAQLHPTAQLEMGSFFAELWNKRKVGSVIETHSGNILLRLRRLIAKRELSHDAVSVAYFTHDEDNNMPSIKNLDINEDGSLQPGLPMEFFGADVIEGLNLGARK